MYKILLLSFEEVNGTLFVNPQVNSIREDLSTLGEVYSIGFSKSPPDTNEDVGKNYYVAFSNHTLPPLFRRFLAVITIIKIYRKIISCTDFDCVYCINFPAMVLGAFSKSSKIYHALEIFGEMSSIPSRFAKMIQFIERIATKNYNAILVPSQARIDYYKKTLGNRTYFMALNSPSILELSKLHIIKSKNDQVFRIVYAGGIGNSRDIRPLVQAIAMLIKNSQIPIELHLYTKLSKSSLYYAELEKMSNDLNVNIIFREYLNSRIEFIEALSTYDCSVAIYEGKRQNNLLCAPTKIVDSALAATPWLCSTLPGSKDALKYIGGGILVDTSDPDSIYRGLLSVEAEFLAFNIDIFGQKLSQNNFTNEILSKSRGSKW